MNLRRKLFIFVVTCLISLNTYAQSITLAIEATFPAEQAEFVYAPLKEYLEKKTGFKIELQVAVNYYFYWRSAKNEQPDFTLDASHVAAYRMSAQNYQPLARVKENTYFHLISDFEPDPQQSLNQFLVGKKVVMLPNPNLASLLFDEWFTDLFLQPQKIVSALSWEDAIEQVFAKTADAAIVPNSLFSLYPNFASLKQSREFPGMTFLAAPGIDAETRDRFKKVLLGISADDEAFDILAELNTDGFVEVDKKDYDKLAEMLTSLFY